MTQTRPVGRSAAVRKYDLLTALGSYALALGPADQRRVLRLITLLTARYDWQRDLLASGQREIARLWSCDERTVKREMAKFRELGWLVLLRAAVRGRVAEYRLDLAKVLAATETGWERVGPDFVARQKGSETESVPEQATVVPLPLRGGPGLSGHEGWDQISRRLHAEDPSAYAFWLARLVPEPMEDGGLMLRAPGKFHAHYIETHLLARLQAAANQAGIRSIRLGH